MLNARRQKHKTKQKYHATPRYARALVYNASNATYAIP
jgi:hypothetical protein